MAAGIAVAGAAVAGCGAVGASGGGPAGPGSPSATSTAPPGNGRAATSLCADPTAVSSVRVVHVPGVGQIEPNKPGQQHLATITVSDPAKARELARAVCSLPFSRHIAVRCPFGGGYQLAFTGASRRLPVVGVQAAACGSVIGAGLLRTTNAGFWAAFARATGIKAFPHWRWPVPTSAVR